MLKALRQYQQEQRVLQRPRWYEAREISRPHARKEGDQKKESSDGELIQWSNCGKKGYLSKAHVARYEEEGPTIFMVSASVLSDVPNFDSKSTEVIDDGVTTPPVSVEPEEELQLGVTKAALARDPIQQKEERVFA